MPAEPPVSSLRFRLFPGLGRCLRILTSLILLILLIRTMDPVQVLSLFRDLGIGWLTTSLLLALLQVPLASIRLGILLDSSGWRVRSSDLLRMTFVSTFLGTFLPSGVGGDLVRLGALAASRVPARTGLAAVAVDRLCGGVGLALAALLASSSALLRQGSLRELAWSGLPALAVLSLALLAWNRQAWRLALLLYRRLSLLPGRDFLRRLHHQVAAWRRQPQVLLRVTGLGLLTQLLRVLSLWAGARAMGLWPGLLPCAEAVLPATLVSMIPISVGGLGVREGLLVLLLPLPAEEALGVALLNRLVMTISNLPGAWWFGGRGLALEIRKGRPEGPGNPAR
jgi:uncharacterized protein (TIRG00374 family)